MARIRTVKPSFWGDDKVSKLSVPARLLFLGLISMADDKGRFLASYPAIVGYVFPNDNVTPTRLGQWLDELECLGVIVTYNDGNGGRVKYGAIPNWRKHQKINRPQPSSLPPPPQEALFHE